MSAESPPYGIGSPATAKVLPLTKQQFVEVKTARHQLLAGLALEQPMELLTRNLIEFETHLARLAIKLVFWPFPNPHEVSEDDRIEVARLLNNFLSTGRLYVDHTKTRVARTFPEHREAILAEIRNAAASAFGIEHQAMEAMRDVLQHQEIPVDSIVYAHQRDDDRQSNRMTSSVIALLDRHVINTDRKFDHVRDELLRLAEKKGQIQILPLAKAHFSTLGGIHQRVRELLEPVLARADATVRKALRDALTFFADDAAKVRSLNGMSLLSRDTEERLFISEEFIERRQRFEQKNQFLDSVVNRHAAPHLSSPKDVRET